MINPIQASLPSTILVIRIITPTIASQLIGYVSSFRDPRSFENYDHRRERRGCAPISKFQATLDKTNLCLTVYELMKGKRIGASRDEHDNDGVRLFRFFCALANPRSGACTPVRWIAENRFPPPNLAQGRSRTWCNTCRIYDFRHSRKGQE